VDYCGDREDGGIHPLLPHPRQRIPSIFCFNTQGGLNTNATAQPVLRLKASRRQSPRQPIKQNLFAGPELLSRVRVRKDDIHQFSKCVDAFEHVINHPAGALR
jgi:hypothetical protein